MPSFFTTGSSTTAQTLAAGENGFVAASGTLYTETATAVTITGSAGLNVQGTVATAEASAAVRTSGTAIAEINMIVGRQGSITSTTTDAIRLAVTGEFRLDNAGHISGRTGLFLTSSEASARAIITNTGTIAALTTGLIENRAITIAAGFETVDIVNHGTISTTDDFFAAIRSDAGSFLRIVNTGTISGSDTAISAEERLSLINSGTIIGDVRADVILDMRNAGTVIGDVVLGQTGSS